MHSRFVFGFQFGIFLSLLFFFSSFSLPLFFQITCTENVFSIALLRLLRILFFFVIDLMPNHFILSILLAHLLFFHICFFKYFFYVPLCQATQRTFPIPNAISTNEWHANFYKYTKECLPSHITMYAFSELINVCTKMSISFFFLFVTSLFLFIHPFFYYVQLAPIDSFI